MRYRIRRARPQDLPNISAIEVAAARLLAGHAPESVLGETTSQDDLNEARRQGRRWIALADDAAVGFAHVVVQERDHAHLEELDVHPEHGRRGLGTRLVLSVCAWAGNSGFAAVTRTTFRDVSWNLPFFERLGFGEVAADALSPSLRAIVRDEARWGLESGASNGHVAGGLPMSEIQPQADSSNEASLPSAVFVPGLAGVVAVRTRLSRVDGMAGELVIAGHRVEDLASRHGFEAVCHLLWHGVLPDERALETLRVELGRRRAAVYRFLLDGAFVPLTDPMDSLRSALGRLESTGDAIADAMMLTAAVPVANAWWESRRTGRPAPEPRPDLTNAADYLRMITGRTPSGPEERGMDRYLVTISDHGLNASTFTARIIASTRSDPVSAVVGAIGALKGPLHGGAPGPVLEMLDAIGDPSRARQWLLNEFAAGNRIMGMGHRVYRVRDPRAAVFERAIAEIQTNRGHDDRLALARAIEAEAEALLAARYPGRNLKANVEFYTAVLLETLGLPREIFAATFAAGRIAGWAAHYIEQREEDRLIRPQSEYIGEEPS
jgi:citrate synthase